MVAKQVIPSDTGLTPPVEPTDFRDYCERVDTPAFVYDTRVIGRLLEYADRLRQATECQVLFSLKPFPYVDALRLMAPHLDGFAASSLFEARLASHVLDGRGSVHMTTPGIRPAEVREMASLCDFISFNSLSQWQTHGEVVSRLASCGLRVNPQMSFVDDERYDPCRPHSKLGVPLEHLADVLKSEPHRLSGIDGILFHSNCESSDLAQVRTTVQHLHAKLGGLFKRIQWINLGGGYLFDESESLRPLCETVDFLHSGCGLQVFIEPGAAFVRAAGYIVSTVLDVFRSGGKNVAVLDTTVNHMPEVFEYGFEPDVLGHDDDARHEYLLAGCTCLAGDLFGLYRFGEPLEAGSKVVFYNAGAYTLPKAHMFNGVNLPTIYAVSESGNLVLKKRFTYADYADRWREDVAVSV